MLRSALLAACAFAACVAPATAYEVLVSEGVVAPRKWVAVASSPSLGAGVASDAAAPRSVPGLITLAPGGALRVTRARASAPAERVTKYPYEDVRAAVLTLGAVPLFDLNEGSRIRVDVRCVETVEGVVVSAAPVGEVNAAQTPNVTQAVKTVDRLVTTSCVLRRGSRGAWEVVKDGSTNPASPTCTAERVDAFFSDEKKSAEGGRGGLDTAAELADDESTHKTTETRIEIALIPIGVYDSKRALSTPFTKRVVARRVDEIAVVAVDDGFFDASGTSTRLIVKTLALLSRGDLVDLAWSWLARATQCASSLRAELVSKCDVKEGKMYASENENAMNAASSSVTVDALVNGCCAAVASYADAGCGCALVVAEGLAPFFVSAPSASNAPGSGMARNDDAHAAAATLEALCFGGRKVNEVNTSGDDDGDEYTYSDALADDETSCVSSSATLAATRAVALEDVSEIYPEETKARTSAFASASPGTSSSPEEREYAAFLTWLDGENSASTLSPTPVDENLPDDVVTFGGGGVSNAAGGSEAGAPPDTSNASRTAAERGAFDGDEDKKISQNAFFIASVVVASLVFATALAAFCRCCVCASRKNGDHLLARANASDDMAFALENGDEVRLVARRRADGSADGA